MTTNDMIWKELQLIKKKLNVIAKRQSRLESHLDAQFTKSIVERANYDKLVFTCDYDKDLLTLSKTPAHVVPQLASFWKENQ